jgi:protein SCO1/2
MRRRDVLVLGSVLILAAIGLGYSLLKPYTFHGSVLEPLQSAPEIQLTNFDGQAFQLSQQRGKVVLLFFGYTSCPDVCPTTLAEFRKVFAELGPKSAQVRAVFITVDPERDTPDKIAAYVTIFHPDFLGLTGSPADLEAVYKAYGVFREKQESGSAAGYLVSHTATVYVIDKQGNLRLTFPYGLGWEAMFKDIRHLLNE